MTDGPTAKISGSDVPGVAERWGKSVLHCPYCHGYEVGGGPIGVLGDHPMSPDKAALVADWGEVTLFTNGARELTEAERALLVRRRVRVVAGRVSGLAGPGTELDGVRLADGRLVPVRAVFVTPAAWMASPIAGALGCAFACIGR